MPENPYPRCSFSKRVIADLVFAGLFKRRRSFRTHALKMVTGIHPPLRIIGEENIPRAGPGIITVNHYHSTAIWPPWLAISISSLVLEDIHWLMAERWTDPKRWLDRYKRSLSGWVLSRVANVYGFSTMPPMPPSPGEVAQRTTAVMRLMKYVRSHPRALIGMAPEGGDQPGAVLSLPPSGFGKLALVFSRMGFPFYPVGAYEEDGFFFIRFGRPYCLQIEPEKSRNEADRQARMQVMANIATCLPNRLRGEFSS